MSQEIVLQIKFNTQDLLPHFTPISLFFFLEKNYSHSYFWTFLPPYLILVQESCRLIIVYKCSFNPKTQGESSLRRIRNLVQHFCEMNGLWRYTFGEIAKPKATSPSEKNEEVNKETEESYDAKLFSWLSVTDSPPEVIRSTCTYYLMFHVGNLKLCSNTWAKFEFLYQGTGFIEQDTILIRLSSKITSDFNGVAYFADHLKRDSTHLKKLAPRMTPTRCSLPGF